MISLISWGIKIGITKMWFDNFKMLVKKEAKIRFGLRLYFTTRVSGD